jgi:UPF0716 protein FxsA
VTIVLVVWIACEVLAFMFVASRIGLSGAILIGLITTFIGLMTLRRISAGAIRSLREAIGGAEPKPGAMLDGALAALGAALLILPGFLSDLVGLALAAPSMRQWLARRFGGIEVPGQPRRSTTGPRTIDLGPSDWHAISDAGKWSDRPDEPKPRRSGD